MNKQLLVLLTEEGYTNLVQIPGRGICGTQRFAFTSGLCYGLDEFGYEGRWCYHTMYEATKALAGWKGESDPPGKWIKFKSRHFEYSYEDYMLNEQIKKEYPIQDDIWPSRRWNTQGTEYQDLSGL